MSELETLKTEALIEQLRDADAWSLPVRVMEDILAVGAGVVEPLLALVRDVDDEDYGMDAVWSAVLLGELRATSAAVPLADVIARLPDWDLPFPLAAAEALGRIGAGAVPALHTLAASPRSSDRMWAYYAAGLSGERAAYQLLLGALESDAELRDAAATALADYGDGAAGEALRRVYERAEPWQHVEIAGAINRLQNPDPQREPRDWRIRYRLNVMRARFPLVWPVVTAIVREDGRYRERTTTGRTLEEQLVATAAAESDPHRCECCNLPTWQVAGLDVCAQTAAALPLMTSELIRRRRDETLLDDVYDLVNHVEIALLEIAEEPEPRSLRERERQEDRTMQLRTMQTALIWIAEQGVRSAGAGSALLHAQAVRAAERYGDPMGVFSPEQSSASTDVAPAERVGRNDPCPCGSGRKYKRCCGAQ